METPVIDHAVIANTRRAIAQEDPSILIAANAVVADFEDFGETLTDEQLKGALYALELLLVAAADEDPSLEPPVVTLGTILTVANRYFHITS